MPTLDAEIVVPPEPIEAQIVSKPAEIANEVTTQTPVRVSLDIRPGIVRRSRR